MALIDLFSGCGGFSLGAHQAGFDVAAAFDNDPTLTSSYEKNFPNTKLFLRDIATLESAVIKEIVGHPITGIFGGPPCQGFSEIGRQDIADPRRKLLKHFFRIVSEIQPEFFIMENVKGLNSAKASGELTSSLALVREHYELLEPVILDAADFGAATKRKRLFVIGFNKALATAISAEDFLPYRTPAATVRQAIEDLSRANFSHEDENGFDHWQVSKTDQPNIYLKSLLSENKTFTGHKITKHISDVAARFSRVLPGEIDVIGRHARLAWEGQCPTLRAGTGSDRGSYQAVRPLHPEEPRVITVREAARLQGFPDSHIFHPTIWHSFRMIGNSVSPIIARAIFLAIGDKLRASNSKNSPVKK